NGFSHQIAWRARNYGNIERVAGVGDSVTIKDRTGATRTVSLSEAGPIDASVDGREFIYLESASANVYGIFELTSNGVFNQLYASPIKMPIPTANPPSTHMVDTPWGQSGFAFADGGVIFKNELTLYMLDPDTQGLTVLAQQELPFIGDGHRIPNLELAQ